MKNRCPCLSNSRVRLTILRAPSLSGYLFLLVFLLPFIGLAQQIKKVQPQVFRQLNDGTDLMLRKLRTSPQYRIAEEKMNQAIMMASSDPRVLAADYRLPVVFHIISNDPLAVTDQQMIDALNDLNQAFSKSGAYAGGDNPLTPGVDTRIQFCLAKKDPDGGNTTGITRTTSFFQDFDVDIEDGRTKNLTLWDPARYVNIWYVTGLKSELLPMFQCGSWTRMHEGGYATMPPGGGITDGIVVTGFGTLLAHEMGHYLGLYHTFEGLNCANSNCALQGDRVCDTPPDAAYGNSVACDQPDNSCNTDTLSGFTVNAPDMISNFMDYGNDNCHKSFTEGQAQRMRAAIATQRNSLLLQNQCDPPCAETAVASFTRDNAYPLPGATINFTNTSTGAANYEWTVDGVVMANTANLTHTFTATGKYKVTLKAYNGTPSCYAIYSDFIIVNCGVTARFYPDKRIIASKAGIFLDSIYFTNRSENANSYHWLMGNDQGMAEQEISTSKDLNYTFLVPAHYTVRLIATDGSCIDTTETFRFNVEDPTADAQVHLQTVDCYQQNKVRVTLYICNSGYAPIPAGTPMTFYDSDPANGHANKIGTFTLPDELAGKCCGSQYTYILDANRPGLNTIYAVFNDNGTTMPLTLPNTGVPEKNYTDNIVVRTQFQFKVTVQPATATLEPGDSLQLSSVAGPGNATYLWTPVQQLTCFKCASPVLIAARDTVAKLIATSQYGCVDSAFSVIKVPPADDYTITINSLECAKNNKIYATFTICNSFRRGIIPKGLKVAFYDADPAGAGAHLLSPVFTTFADSLQHCASFAHLFSQAPASRIYAVVNDQGSAIPVQLPNTSITEKNYTNNKNSLAYVPPVLLLHPQDTTVFRKQSFTYRPSANFNPAGYNWSTSKNASLSCNGCATPLVTVYDSAMINLEVTTLHGCILPAHAQVKIFPPDMTIEILETACYTDASTLVKFKINMNNGYDSVFKNIPVAFYDASPVTRNPRQLTPSFITPETTPGSSAIFTQVVETPPSQTIYAIVNDQSRGTTTPPDILFPETNYHNNVGVKKVLPFQLLIDPADTSVQRASSIRLSGKVTGGEASIILWQPSQGLCCTHCLATIATPDASIQYQLTVQNEFSCTAIAFSTVKTFTGRKINIPSAFTPNNDGLNDVFYIMAGKEVKQVVNLSVFNRWGEKVFESVNSPANDRTYGWTGLFKGKVAIGGTYVYLTTIELVDGVREVYKGTVTLIR